MSALSLPALDQLALTGFRGLILQNDALVTVTEDAYPLLPTGIVAVGPKATVAPRQILITNRRLTRERLGREPVEASELVSMNYRTLPMAVRGMTKAGQRIDKVELPLTLAAKRSLIGYFLRCLHMNASSPEEVASYEGDILALAEALAGGTDLDAVIESSDAGTPKESPRHKAARMLGTATVADVLERNNLRRLPLKFASADKALAKDVKRLRGTSLVVNLRAVICTHLMDECIGKAEGLRQVAKQAITAPYMRTSGDFPERKRAVGFWRDHADDMERVFFAPFAGYFFSAAKHFRSAAAALEEHDLPTAQRMLMIADAVLSLVVVSAEASNLMLTAWPFVDEEIARRAEEDDIAVMEQQIRLLHNMIPRVPSFIDTDSGEHFALRLAHQRLTEAQTDARVEMRSLDNTLHALERELNTISDQLLTS